MSIYTEKARELGDLLLQSEQSMRYADAKAAFSADEAAIEKLDNYNSLQQSLQMAMNSDIMTPQQFREATQRLRELAADVQEDEVVSEMLAAEREYNLLVDGVMLILRGMTGAGMASGGGCGSGGCAGCSGCGF